MDTKNKKLKNSNFKNSIVKQLYFDTVLSCAELRDPFNRSFPVISKAIGDAIMDPACNVDPFAVDLLSEAGYKIGRALAILIRIINTETIILSSRSVKIGKLLLAPVQHALNKYGIARLAAHESSYFRTGL